jgi:hypothetical protein
MALGEEEHRVKIGNPPSSIVRLPMPGMSTSVPGLGVIFYKDAAIGRHIAKFRWAPQRILLACSAIEVRLHRAWQGESRGETLADSVGILDRLVDGRVTDARTRNEQLDVGVCLHRGGCNGIALVGIIVGIKRINELNRLVLWFL